MSDGSPSRRFRVARWLVAYAEPVDRVDGIRSSRSTRPLLVVHLVSLVAIAAVYVVLARDQWFFYDEWDLLRPGNEWNLLAPHNGHLSLGLALVMAVVKSMVGLHAYWPYLAVTIGFHLAIVHLLWRLMNRVGVQPLIALLLSLVFAFLAPGAENTLWAFQTGFIAPLAFGLGAFLIIDRSTSRSSLVQAAALLAAGLLFSSTAIPLLVAALAFVWVRGRRLAAIVIALAIGIPYLVWRLVFVGRQATDSVAASGPGDLLVAVPQYIVRGLVDGIASIGPFAPVAGALLVVLAIWLLRRAARTAFAATPVWSFLILGLAVFALLTAVSRVGLGPESASAGRYVYVEAVLAFPAIGVALSAAATRRAALGAVAVGLVVLVGYNGVGLAVAARSQGGLEQFTREAVSAAVAVGGHADAAAVPLPIVAPTLTMGEIRSFVASGAFTPTAFDSTARLSAEVGLTLTARRIAAPGALTDCVPDAEGGFQLPAGASHQVLLNADTATPVTVTVTQAGVSSAFTRIVLDPGAQQLIGFEDADIRLSVPGTGGICVPLSSDAAAGG